MVITVAQQTVQAGEGTVVGADMSERGCKANIGGRRGVQAHSELGRNVVKRPSVRHKRHCLQHRPRVVTDLTPFISTQPMKLGTSNLVHR